MKKRGFHWFVAMRYLRGAHRSAGSGKASAQSTGELAGAIARGATRAAAKTGVPLWLLPVGLFAARAFRLSSKVLLILTGLCVASAIGFLVVRYGVLATPKPNSFRPVDPWVQRTELGAVISIALMVIFGTMTVLRGVLSFFSTVSIVGVWIGTMALVFVLSVMSGFESDLRQKILGSNAHIQVSREDGDFTEWEAIKAKVEKVPGVVASTPFAVSEVVIAANNNYFNVIIKGIDPESIGRVTQLIDDIQCGDEKCSPAEAKEIVARLEPLVDDDTMRAVPQDEHPTGDVIDKAPDNMVDGTDPIDFSGAGVGSGAGSGDDGDGDGDDDDGGGGGDDHAGGDGFGGDAPGVMGLDAAPGTRPPDRDAGPAGRGDPDGAEGDDDDGSGGDDGATRVVTINPTDFSPPSHRTKLLPGVLVGRELTKQIHLYTDQEVRMVSPMSDPANPDATGTPIPFNRDYRVAGMFFTGMYEYDLKFVYVTLDSLQDFLDRGDAVDGLEVRITDPDDTDSVRGAIQKTLGKDYRVQDWQELNRSLFSALKLEKIAMFLVLAIIILVASFSIVGNLVMVVVEKGKEIALLKTLGASDRGVTWIFITQGFFIGAIGTGLGVVYGLVGCVLAKRFGIPINPDVYYIDRLPIHIDLPSVALIAAAGVLISVGATVYPAMVAARLAPSVGLRH